MNKERYNHIIDDAWKNYQHKASKQDFLKDGVLRYEGFINKIKTDSEFSEKWGLKIVERELSFEERLNIAIKMRYDSFDLDIAMGNSEDALSDYGIPTKLITLMYNNETIEIYE